MECTERKVSEDFGAYIRHLRQRKGLSLNEVEQQSKVSASYISRLENGDRVSPSFPFMEKLANCYGVPVLDLCKSALQNKDEVVESQTFEILMYSNQFTIFDKEVDTQMKKKIVLLLNQIAKADFSNNHQYEEMGTIMQIVSDLKNYF